MTKLLEKVIALSRQHAAKKNESVDAWFTRQLHERMENRRLQRPQPNLPFVHLSEVLAGQGFEAQASSPEAFAALIAAEQTRWARAIKLAGTRLD